jgi:hypothetical protein
MVRQQHKLEETPCETLLSAAVGNHPFLSVAADNPTSAGADSLRSAAVGNHPLPSSAVADNLKQA